MPGIGLHKNDTESPAAEIPAASSSSSAAAGGEEHVTDREEGEGDADPSSTPQDIEEIKRRLKDIEDDAVVIRKIQAMVKNEMVASVTPKDIEDMKRRLKDIEDEADALRKMLAKVKNEMVASVAAVDPAISSEILAAEEEAEYRTIFIGNVDCECTPEAIQQHFQSCGTVNKVTIFTETDEFGQPKGFARVEFMEAEAVLPAVLMGLGKLSGSVHRRPAK